jgi:FkbM family methyltransferase
MIDFSMLGTDTLAGKILRFPFRLLPPGMTVPILQGPLRGKKWILGSQRYAFWLGGYEPQMQRLMARELRQGSTFYDVGANVGFYSLLSSFRINPGKVFAFEPLPSNVSYLFKHLELNHVENVQVLQIAISNEVGTANFQSERTGAMGRLDLAGNVQVKVSTLDALLQSGEIAPPDYVKMDIEGLEFNALLGAKDCFQKFRPTLFLATHGAEVNTQCRRLLGSWKYEVREVGLQSSDRGDLVAHP